MLKDWTEEKLDFVLEHIEKNHGKDEAYRMWVWIHGRTTGSSTFSTRPA